MVGTAAIATGLGQYCEVDSRRRLPHEANLRVVPLERRRFHSRLDGLHPSYSRKLRGYLYVPAANCHHEAGASARTATMPQTLRIDAKPLQRGPARILVGQGTVSVAAASAIHVEVDGLAASSHGQGTAVPRVHDLSTEHRAAVHAHVQPVTVFALVVSPAHVHGPVAAHHGDVGIAQRHCRDRTAGGEGPAVSQRVSMTSLSQSLASRLADSISDDHGSGRSSTKQSATR